MRKKKTGSSLKGRRQAARSLPIRHPGRSAHSTRTHTLCVSTEPGRFQEREEHAGALDSVKKEEQGMSL